MDDSSGKNTKIFPPSQIGRRKNISEFQTDVSKNVSAAGVCEHVLCDLHGVECGAFLDLVSDQPEGESVGVGNVFAQTAGIDGVLACGIKRHRIFLGCGFVNNHQTFSLFKGFAGLLDTDGLLGLNPDSFAVGAHHRDTDAGGADFKLRSVHDLLGLVIHLHLFLGIVVVKEHVDVGNEVVGKLIGEFLDCWLFAFGEFGILLSSSAIATAPAPLAA